MVTVYKAALHTARPHTFGGFRDFNIYQAVCVFTMDFPPVWTVLTSEEYETATPRITGDVSMEICAQLRPSGRILDNFRVSHGGTKILEYEADLGQLIPIPFFKGWRVKGQCWARDVAIRANIFSFGLD
jgi:hypothetical protein